MKKTFSALGAFCLGAFITIGVMACADDYSEYNPSIQSESASGVVEVRNTLEGWYYDFDFIYDEAGRISQVQRELYYVGDGPQYYNNSFDITYSDNMVKMQIEDNRTITIKFAKDVKSYSVGVVNDHIIDAVVALYH